MEIKTFGVIGAGQMGGGIAQVASAGGLHVILNDIKTEFVEQGLADPKYRPCPLLRQYVEAGWLGCKTGRGFYEYTIEK